MANHYFATQFGVDNDLITRTLTSALDNGADFAELFIQHKTGDHIGFEDGQVNRAVTQVDLGAGIRALNGDQTGYAFTEDLSSDRLFQAAKTAASIASGKGSNGPNSLNTIEIPQFYENQWVWGGVPPKQKIDLVQSLGERIQAGDPLVIKAGVYFASEDETVLIANSDGIIVEDVRPMTILYATCTAEKQGQRQSNMFSRSSRQGFTFYTDELLDEIAEQTIARTLVLFDAVTPPPGEMPVVLAPASSGILLHEALGHGFEADFIRKETSVFSSMMGQPVAEPFVTIVDTGLVQNARGALNVDDEGCPGQRTVLVENGRLASFLHDRVSAAHFSVAPTGNGRRQDFRHPPLPRMRVTTMESGPHDPQEIIGSVQRGLYAVDFSNGEVAIGAGDYSFYVKTGYLIEEGKLTAPIKDVNLIGNGPDSLTKVTMVGNDKAIDQGTWTCGKDGQGVPVGLGLPTIKVSSITVGGATS